MSREPIDQDVRDRIIKHTGESHFVTAGAGAGKSTSIIERIITLICDPDSAKRIRMDQLVAVTFTEKAAAELRHKLREKLGKHITKLEPGTQAYKDAVDGLAEVDGAAVGTIHSFALRLLRQYPLEAGLPLGFSVIDVGEAKKAFRQVSQEILTELFVAENAGKIDKLAESQIDLNQLMIFVREIGLNHFKLKDCNFLTLGPEPDELEPIIREWAQFAHSKFGEALEKRKKTGLINFDDLLILAHNLVASDLPSSNEVRKNLAKKYQFYVVDEFQDTDPVQWQMIRSLVCDPENRSSGPIPGKLVVVGDPKQSIYKFRGADITNFESVKTEATELWGQESQQHLIANFRSQPKIVDFVDSLYKDRPPLLGTDFESMHAEVDATEDQEVFVLDPGEFDYVSPNSKEYKTDPHYYKEVREPAERRAVAAVVQSVVGKKYITPHNGEGGERRLAKYSDIALLLPARTSLVEQLQLFEELNIPFKSTDGTVVYSRPVVRSLIASLRVIAGSVNGKDLWWALKSPLYGADDRALLEFSNQGNYWPVPIATFREEKVKGGRSIISEALGHLFNLYETNRTSQPSELLELIYESTQLHQSIDQLTSGEFDHSCVRMVIFHAKQWEASGGSGILDYIDWLDQMEEEEVRENLPSPDVKHVDAITVSTMHSAKGLEYEVVILGGMKHGVTVKLPMCAVGPDGNFEYQFYIASGATSTREEVYSKGYYDNCLEHETKLVEQENHRLLYVAATRAKSYLFYSIFHQGISKGSYFGNPWSSYVRAQVLESVAQMKAVSLTGKELEHTPVRFFPISKPSISLEDSGKLGHIARAAKISNTSTIHKPSDGDSKIEFYSDALEQAAAYGTAFHAIMEDISARGFDPAWKRLEEKIGQRAEEFKVLARQGDLVRDVRVALENPLITRARGSRWVKSEQALNGFIGEHYTSGIADLYFEDEKLGGLVVVDYKTNATLPPEVIEKYRMQLNDYSVLLEIATGMKVVERFLLHVQGGVAKEVTV